MKEEEEEEEEYHERWRTKEGMSDVKQVKHNMARKLCDVHYEMPRGVFQTRVSWAIPWDASNIN